MSPEQASGHPVSFQSDQFSFGSILYEIATGERAFRRETLGDTLAAVLEDEPKPIAALNPSVPATFQSIVESCLSKNPEDRYGSTRDLARELERLRNRLSEHDPPRAAADAAKPKSRTAPFWVAAALFACCLGLTVWFHYLRAAPTVNRAIRFPLYPPEKTSFRGAGALSPDGSRVTFTAVNAVGQTSLWVRPLDSTNAQELPGTEGAAHPFWSPDSRYIGFFAQGKLKKIDFSGTPIQTLCDAPQGRGGSWNAAGTILFSPNERDGLYRVPAAGGTPLPVTMPSAARREYSHRWPHFLPDGRHFLYLAQSTDIELRGIYLGSLEADDLRFLVSVPSAPAYSREGYLLYLREATLIAQPFDATNLRNQGKPSVIAQHVAHARNSGEAAFSVSDNGLLIYGKSADPNTQLTWFDRTGQQLGLLAPPGEYRCPELSHDERRVAVERRSPEIGTYDIWLIDLPRGTPARLTFGPSNETNASWSPDDRRIAFTSNLNGHWDIYQRLADPAGADEIVFESSVGKNVEEWSQDGRFIVYTASGPTMTDQVWVLPLFGDRKAQPFFPKPFREAGGRISPNGRWMAYASEESGTLQVYVQNFPATDVRWQISTNGGAQPLWRRDGKELFYIAADKNLMSVAVKEGPAFEHGVPVALFQTGVSGLVNARNHYTVTRDGQRFLVNVPLNKRPFSR